MRTFHPGAIVTLAWTLIFVVVIDVAISTVFRMPASNHDEPTQLQRYFDYGRTVEGKLQRMLGTSDADAAPIVSAGWLERECTKSIPAPAAGTIGMSSYGMSFSNNIADALQAEDHGIRVAFRAGPSASVNHSYACFRMQHDAALDPNPVQVIGVLASSLDRTLTLSGLTTSFEVPMPFTYPRYRLDADGKLTEELPLVDSAAKLRDPGIRRAFFDQLARSDASFKPWLMNADLGDHSALVRIVRRAYAQHEGASRVSEWAVPARWGAREQQIAPVVSALLRDFAERARASGQRPIVLLIQDRPGKDELYRLLAPRLREDRIPFVSTHELVPTTDAANFLPDSHFTAAGNRRIAARLDALIRSGPDAAPDR